MKTAKNILAMIFVATTMLFASCGDKEEKTLTAKDLNGTSWEANIVNSASQGGVQMNIDLHFALDFTSTTEYEMFMDLNLEVPTYPAANQRMNETDAGTYTIDGNKLVMTSTDGTNEVLTYNSKDDTFSMSVPDDEEELHEMLGADKVIFHRTR